MSPVSAHPRLLESLDTIKVIDAHEHLLPEKRRLERKVDFSILFSTYTRADLVSAGMPEESYARLRDDTEMALEEKWELFNRFYPMIRHGSYSRPAQIWLKEVLKVDDLTKENYREVSERLQENNTPGLYDRVLRGMCNIEAALVAPNPVFEITPSYAYDEHDMDLLRPLWRAINYTSTEYVRKFLAERQDGDGADMAAYLDWVEKDFRKYEKMGVFGIKAMCDPFEVPNMGEAERVFKSISKNNAKSAALTETEKRTLGSAIYDRVFQIARDRGLTVAVHSGVWGDFRDSQPAHLIPVAMRYGDVSFDLFHLGMPYVREALMIGKMFPNVSLNLCWNTVVSPEQTFRMLDECLDMLPINNVIAFGGDYNLPVEKVYGHLKMTKEVVAKVLSKRIHSGQLDLEEARRIAEMWFYANPRRIYNLSD